MDALKRLLVSPLVWILITVHILYGLATVYIPRIDLLTLMSGLLFASSIAVVVAFAKDILRILEYRQVEREDFLLIGIVTIFCSTACLRGFVGIMRALGLNKYISDNPLLGLFLLWSTISCGFMLAALHAHDGQVPRKTWVQLGIVAGLGSAIAFLLIFLGNKTVL